METSFFFRLTFLFLKISKSWEVMVQAFNPNTWETEDGKSLSSRPAWCIDRTQDRQSYTKKPCLEKQNSKQNKAKYCKTIYYMF